MVNVEAPDSSEIWNLSISYGAGLGSLTSLPAFSPRSGGGAAEERTLGGGPGEEEEDGERWPKEEQREGFAEGEPRAAGGAAPAAGGGHYLIISGRRRGGGRQHRRRYRRSRRHGCQKGRGGDAQENKPVGGHHLRLIFLLLRLRTYQVCDAVYGVIIARKIGFLDAVTTAFTLVWSLRNAGDAPLEATGGEWWFLFGK